MMTVGPSIDPAVRSVVPSCKAGAHGLLRLSTRVSISWILSVLFCCAPARAERVSGVVVDEFRDPMSGIAILLVLSLIHI